MVQTKAAARPPSRVAMASKAAAAPFSAALAHNSEMLREYVYQALLNKITGKDVYLYTGLVRDISSLRKKTSREPGDPGQEMLANLVHAVRGSVSLLQERLHDGVLTEILSIKLWSSPPIVRNAVLELMSTLVMVNTSYTHTCLRLLVTALLPPPQGPADLEAAQGPWQPSEDETCVQADVTAALGRVLERVPTSPAPLIQLLSSHMPHRLRDRATQCLYFTALFTVAEAPTGGPVRDALLAVAVEQLLALDVEIRWEDIVEAPTEEAAEEAGREEDEVEEMFQLDGLGGLDLNATPEQLEAARAERLAQLAGHRGGWEGAGALVSSIAGSDGASGGGAGAGASATRPVDETANKLDSLMELAFAHLAARCDEPTAGGPGPAWAALLACFERTILHTHRSKFAQFLVFFMCTRRPDPFARLFIEFLLTRLQDGGLPHITRTACAAYLASFLARSVAVPPILVVNALDALTVFAGSYAASAAAGVPSAPAPTDNLTAKHGVFYAAVQAVLYVLCYHLESLLSRQHSHHHRVSVPDATRTLITARLLPLLACLLQPLAVCLPSVVAEFRSQLTALGLVPNGAAVGLPQTPLTGPRAAQRPLEMFFPFDPYLLKRSSRFLQLPTTYRSWRRGHATAAAVAALSESDADDCGNEAMDTPVQAPVRMHSDEDLDLSDSGSDTTSTSSGDEEDGGDGWSDANGSFPAHGGMAHLPAATTTLRHLPRSRKPPLHGGAARQKPWGNGLSPGMMGASFDPPHGGSYGTWARSSMGEQTPTGTSPVLVDYRPSAGPGIPLGGNADSGGPVGGTGPGGELGPAPMAMTPHFHHSMDMVPSRLAAAAAAWQ